MRVAITSSFVITGSLLSSPWIATVDSFAFTSQSHTGKLVNQMDTYATSNIQFLSSINDNNNRKQHKHNILSMSTSSSSSSSSLPSSSSNTQVKIPVSNLRSAKLTNVNGEEVLLGDKMGTDGTNIVIFLRHMG